jgi:hypothetical protein
MSANSFEIVRGDDATIVVRVLDENDEPIDLTTYTIFFTAKKNPKDPDSDAVLQMEVDGEADGEVEINFTAEDTSVLKPRSYWWDVQLEKDGVITSTTKQLFRLSSDITRRITGNAS